MKSGYKVFLLCAVLGCVSGVGRGDELLELKSAIISGEIEATENYLTTKPTGKGIDVNVALDQDKNRPLHIAVNENQIKIVELLIHKFRADVNAKNNLGRTPLYVALADGHDEIARFLIDNRADVNEKDSRGKTILSVAIRNGRSTQIIKFLIYKDVKREEETVYTEKIEKIFEKREKFPLYLAMEVGKFPRGSAKLDISKIDNEGRTVLHSLIIGYEFDPKRFEHRHPRFNFTDQNWMKMDDYGKTAYDYATWRVIDLVGPSIDTSGREITRFKSTNIHEQLKSKEDLNLLNHLLFTMLTPAHYATTGIGYKFSKSQPKLWNQYSPLGVGRQMDEVDKMKKILAEYKKRFKKHMKKKVEFSIDYIRDETKTLLMQAAFLGFFDTATFLIKKEKANVNSRDADGDTPLNKAIIGSTNVENENEDEAKKYKQLIKLLIDSDADPFIYGGLLKMNAFELAARQVPIFFRDDIIAILKRYSKKPEQRPKKPDPEPSKEKKTKKKWWQ